MNIEDAVKVLNEHKHCNADWSVEIGLNGPLVVGVVRGEHGRWKADHDPFDAIAIAEKLDRDAGREAAALRRNREALSLDAVMPLLEAIVAEADALDENDMAPVADYLDVSGYVSTTIGQLRAVVAAWKARRSC